MTLDERNVFHFNTSTCFNLIKLKLLRYDRTLFFIFEDFEFQNCWTVILFCFILREMKITKGAKTMTTANRQCNLFCASLLWDGKTFSIIFLTVIIVVTWGWCKFLPLTFFCDSSHSYLTFKVFLQPMNRQKKYWASFLCLSVRTWTDTNVNIFCEGGDKSDPNEKNIF